RSTTSPGIATTRRAAVWLLAMAPPTSGPASTKSTLANRSSATATAQFITSSVNSPTNEEKATVGTNPAAADWRRRIQSGKSRSPKVANDLSTAEQKMNLPQIGHR